MDPRRFLILAGLGLSLSGCAVFGRIAGPPPVSPLGAGRSTTRPLHR